MIKGYQMPENTILYSIVPFGINTGLVEAFPHYLVRVAEAHSVTPRDLIYKSIFPFLGKTSNSTNQQIISGIGSNSPLTEETVQAMQLLTFRTDIMAMTLLNYRHIISNSKLFRKSNAWCPKCYADPNTRFDTLISTLNVVKICPVHGEPLVENCPNCGKTFLTLSLYRIPGFCPSCQGFIGHLALYLTKEHNSNTKHQLWIIQNLIELLQNSGNAKSYSKNKILLAIELYIQKFTNRNISEFCYRTSISTSNRTPNKSSDERGWESFV
jgi:hypothetical protein